MIHGLKRSCTGFGWDSCEKESWYNQVKEKIPDISAAGFTHVWLPPPSESVAEQASRSRHYCAALRMFTLSCGVLTASACHLHIELRSEQGTLLGSCPMPKL